MYLKIIIKTDYREITKIKVLLKRDGSVSKMRTSGGRQIKTAPILRLRTLVHPNQTWMFPLYKMALKIPKCTKCEINSHNFFQFVVSLVCFQNLKIVFYYMS